MPGNIWQRLPRNSKECMEFPDEHEELMMILIETLICVSEKASEVHLHQTNNLTKFKLEKYIPKVHAEFKFALKWVPYGGRNIPIFSSMVLNVNAILPGHRDHKDHRYCMVIPIGDFKGGELVLHELGLVFALQAGSILIFDSKNITHLNLDYTGERASLVFNVDRDLLRHAVDSTRGKWAGCDKDNFTN